MDYKEYYQAREKDLLKELIEFLSIPSVSTDSQYKKSVLQAADWVENKLSTIGFQTQRWEGPGYPVVFGELINNPSGKTLLFYGHYDVQPPDPLDLWKTPPFEPDIRDGHIYARGAQDNKGQNFYVLTAIQAFLENHPSPPFNIKVIIEGEEESGSQTLHKILPNYTKELCSDYLFVVDSGMGSWESPSLVTGVKGIMAMEVAITISKTDLHSGEFGGIAYNPNRILAEVLSKAIDKDGKVTVPHFYDAVKTCDAEQKKELNTEFYPERIEKEIGLTAFFHEKGKNPIETNFFSPTFEINGMWGGYTQEGFKTVIPKMAQAKISCRLVPDQDPKEIYQNVCAFIKNNLPKGAEASFTSHEGGKAIWTSPKSSSVQIMQKVYKEVFGSSSLILCGGSIPIVKDLADAAQAEIVFPGVGLDTDNIHAPNERFSLKQIQMGFLIIAKTLEHFNALKPSHA